MSMMTASQGLDPLDASVAEEGEHDHDGLAEDGEQHRAGETGEILDHVVHCDPGK
jgi:hypothetical protein